MIGVFGRSRKIVLWSLYGFTLVFAIFVSNSANAQYADRASALEACWALTEPTTGYNSSPSAPCTVGSQYSPAGYIHIATGSCPVAYAQSYNNYGPYPASYSQFPLTTKSCTPHWSSDLPTTTVGLSLIYFYYGDTDPQEACSDEDFGQGAGAIWVESLQQCFSADFPPENSCESGEFSEECSVACPQSDYYLGGYVGYGQSCGTTVGSDVSFTDNPSSDYGCVGEGSLTICGTGLTNGGTGSGVGGSHTTSDTFFEYCRANPDDYECLQTFAESPLPTCQNGQQADPELGCDWLAAPDQSCPSGQQIDSNGACVDYAQAIVPTGDPNPSFVGGNVTGGNPSGGGGNDTEPFDDSGIIAANNETRDAVEEGNGILLDQLDTLNGIEECLKGEGDCTPSALPTAKLGDRETAESAFSSFYGRISNAPITNSFGSITSVATFSGGSCPTPSFAAFNTTFLLDGHCSLWEIASPVISVVMYVVWSLFGWRKFTEAW